MSQIDLVPTVTLTLGLPIPFSSLGMAIPEVFLPFYDTQDLTKHYSEAHNDGYTGRVTREFLTALRMNAQQIQRYLRTYVHYSDDFPPDAYHLLEEKLAIAHKLYDGIVSEEESRTAEDRQTVLTEAASAYVDYIRSVKAMCQSVWAKFDDRSILKGLFILLFSICLTPVTLLNVSRAIHSLHKATTIGFTIGTVVAIVSVLLHPAQLELSFNGLISLVIPLVFSSLLLSCLLYLGKMRQEVVLRVSSLMASRHGFVSLLYGLTFLQVVTMVVVVLYNVSMLSNSFILYEGDVVAFFLQSMIACFMFRRLKSVLSASHSVNRQKLSTILNTVLPFVVHLACVRITKLFHSCRDLQVGCEVTSFTFASSSAVETLGTLWKWRFLISCVSVTLVPVGLAVFISKNKNSRFIGQHLLMAVKFGLPVASLFICGVWLIQSLPQATLDELSHWQHVLLPRIVYGISGTTIALLVSYPFRNRSQSLVINEGADQPEKNIGQAVSVSSTADSKLQSSTRLRTQKETVEAPTLPAISQVHLTSTVVLPLLVLVVAVWLPIAMLLNDAMALSAVVMVVQVASFILAVERSEEGQSWCLLEVVSSKHTLTVAQRCVVLGQSHILLRIY